MKTTYIALLRGINVGGHNKIKMEDLRKLLISLGFQEVTTYIQSGNVVFKDGERDARVLARRIGEAIFQAWKMEVVAFVRDRSQLKTLLENNPYSEYAQDEENRLYVSFLAATPETSDLEKMKAVSFPPDDFRIAGEEIYLYCQGGYGVTKLSNPFFENRLKVKATTRNWRTVSVLCEMAEKMELNIDDH